jgi:hypothetical protein
MALLTSSDRSLTSSDRSEAPLAKPVFAILIGAGYVYLALFFYFMFNNVHSTPG